MMYLDLSDGLYKVRQPSPRGVMHHAILDIGNRSRRRLPVGYRKPVIIHLVRQGIIMEWVDDSVWEVMDIIDDEENAIARMDAALMNPIYNLFFNNCEHFSNYVTYGVRSSSQVQAVAGIATFIALVAWVDKRSNRAARSY